MIGAVNILGEGGGFMGFAPFPAFVNVTTNDYGGLMYWFGQYGEAVDHYEVVIGMQPESVSSLAFLGGAQMQAGRFGDAEGALF